VFLRALKLPATFAPLLTTAMAAEAEDREMNVHNNPGDTTCRLYGTNSGLIRWGKDVTASSTPPNGTKMAMKHDTKHNQCRFDFRIEFEDGTSAEERRVDLRRVGDFTWN